VVPNLVSIIIPAYNHASALPKCLAHVFAQTYTLYEVIVVDDGSTDEIVDAIKPFTEKIRLVRQQNAGASPARNRGWKEAQGEFLLFCDADVVMRSDMLEKMVAALRAHPDAGYAYSAFRFGWKLFPGAPWSADLLRRVNIAHTTSLVRAADFPGFDESIRRFQDWDVWLTMLARGKGGVMVPDELFVAEIHGISRIGSSWLPKMAYSIPWEKMGWIPARVKKYRTAREIIAKKHQL
jgi:glycosyltransferase involved in cell wall biosynthesis